MKAIIIYQGRYGATRQYVSWLAEALGLPVHTTAETGGKQLDAYDTVILGTSVYIGKLEIKKWLAANLPYLKNKRILVLQVAATPPSETAKRQAYNKASIPEELMPHCRFFFLPGRMRMKELSWKDRLMLKMGARLTKDPQERATMLTDFDELKKNHLDEVMAALGMPVASEILL